MFVRACQNILYNTRRANGDRRMFEPQPFDREKHVYRCDAFSELLKDAVRVF